MNQIPMDQVLWRLGEFQWALFAKNPLQQTASLNIP